MSDKKSKRTAKGSTPEGAKLSERHPSVFLRQPTILLEDLPLSGVPEQHQAKVAADREREKQEKKERAAERKRQEARRLAVVEVADIKVERADEADGVRRHAQQAAQGRGVNFKFQTSMRRDDNGIYGGTTQRVTGIRCYPPRG